MNRTYSIVELSDRFVTTGMTRLIKYEITVIKDAPYEYVKSILDYIFNYLQEKKASIIDQETMTCGCWMFRFVSDGTYFEIEELKQATLGVKVFAPGLEKTASFLKDQINFTSSLGVEPSFPKIDQKLAISPEIYQGGEASGVRYKAPPHMTGWYLTSDAYSGDIKSLYIDHLYHVLHERPDLAKFLALPVGFRFYRDSQTENCWFDEKAAQEQ